MVTCQVLRRACLLKQISPDGSVYVVIDRLVIDLESRPSGTALLKLTEIVDTSGLPHLRRPHEQHGRSPTRSAGSPPRLPTPSPSSPSPPPPARRGPSPPAPTATCGFSKWAPTRSQPWSTGRGRRCRPRRHLIVDHQRVAPGQPSPQP